MDTFHAHPKSHRHILLVVLVGVYRLMALPTIFHRVGPGGVPCWYVRSTADAHAPVSAMFYYYSPRVLSWLLLPVADMAARLAKVHMT